MPNTRYLMIVKMFKEINDEEIHLDRLKKFVMMHIATRPKAVIEILRDMEDLGFIKENPEKHFYYKINKNGNVQ